MPAAMQGAMLQAALEGAQTTRVAQVTAFLFLAYDCMICLRQEMQTLWVSRWTFPKALFFYTRYWGLITLLADAIVANTVSPTSQVGWIYFSAGNHLLFLAFGLNSLFLLRICALYGKALPVVVGLGTLYLAEAAVTIANQILSNPRPMILPSLGGGVVQVCLETATPHSLGIVAQAMCLSRSSLYLLLTAYKWYTFLDDDERPLADRILRRGERPRQIRSLVTLFVRDEAAVFFIITMMQVVMSVVAFKPGLGMYSGAVFQWFIAALAVCGCRLVLNLHARFTEDRSRRATLSAARPVRVEMHRMTHTVSSGPQTSAMDKEADFVTPEPSPALNKPLNPGEW